MRRKKSREQNKDCTCSQEGCVKNLLGGCGSTQQDLCFLLKFKVAEKNSHWFCFQTESFSFHNRPSLNELAVLKSSVVCKINMEEYGYQAWMGFFFAPRNCQRAQAGLTILRRTSCEAKNESVFRNMTVATNPALQLHVTVQCSFHKDCNEEAEGWITM